MGTDERRRVTVEGPERKPGATIGDVYADAEAVFRFSRESRPQDRAHDYLREHEVARGYDDTAMLCAVDDMIARAYAAGRDDGTEEATGVEAMREAMGQMGRALIAAAEGR